MPSSDSPMQPSAGDPISLALAQLQDEACSMAEGTAPGHSVVVVPNAERVVVVPNTESVVVVRPKANVTEASGCAEESSSRKGPSRGPPRRLSMQRRHSEGPEAKHEKPGR